jgi:hypothetical protein
MPPTYGFVVFLLWLRGSRSHTRLGFLIIALKCETQRHANVTRDPEANPVEAAAAEPVTGNKQVETELMMMLETPCLLDALLVGRLAAHSGSR